MGRKNRSSSFGNGNDAPITTSAGSGAGTSSKPTLYPPDALAACHALLEVSIHATDNHDAGTTFLHRAVRAAASTTSPSLLLSREEDARNSDGLFLMDTMIRRAKEADSAAAASSRRPKLNRGNSNNNGGTASLSRARSSSFSGSTNNNASNASGATGGGGSESNTTHLRRMMLAREHESGYTPLHDAVSKRDAVTLLLLLRHAASGSADGGTGASETAVEHPLRILDGNLKSSENESLVMNEVATAKDREHLTPLQLLGATSANELERCRESLALQAKGRSKKGKLNHRRRRRRMSMGEENDDDDASSSSEEEEEGRRSGSRLRGGSFDAVVYDDNNDEDDDDDVEGNEGEAEDEERRGAAPDLAPFGNFDFSVLGDEDADNDSDDRSDDDADDDEDGDNDNHGNNAGEVGNATTTAAIATVAPNTATVSRETASYGCEVLTFGRADHCALGVPHFATAGRRERRGEGAFFGGGGMGVTSATPASAGKDGGGEGGKSSGVGVDASSASSYKPRRVEAFALGEMRRDRCSESSSSSSSPASSTPEVNSGNTNDNRATSPAISVAAAAHHTLVATSDGGLYAFGLGRGGRLGTGDENHRPLPTRVLGPLAQRKVTSIAAAENHSLCSTGDGDVFAWGSNRFGQLGIRSSTSKLAPRRVEDLKSSFVISVAAGDRHSVALTKQGEVYAWGDNRAGQLGTKSLLLHGERGDDGGRHSSTAAASAASSVPTPTTAGRNCSHRPHRVDGLWSAFPRRKAIAIGAAEFATLVLSSPPVASGASLPVNAVYGWGHGNHVPMRVTFPADGGAGRCINPTAIACARYHNVAITGDGRVYTWGLHSESLGIEKQRCRPSPVGGDLSLEWIEPTEGKKSSSQSNNGNSTHSIPRLVIGMLPENGGGCAVAVSASESHTAIVTADGHLFTWGSSYGNDVLGHKGVRWQPCPRKVKRVHRAVGVAVAKEHTVLLIGTSFPSLPEVRRPVAVEEIVEGASAASFDPMSLQDACAVEISRNVDMYNVIKIAVVAQRLNCRTLIEFCSTFMQKNLDGVLSVANKSDLDCFLRDHTVFYGKKVEDVDRDGVFHPLVYGISQSKDWIERSRSILNGMSRGMPSKQRRRPKKMEKAPLRQFKWSIDGIQSDVGNATSSTMEKGMSSAIQKVDAKPAEPSEFVSTPKNPPEVEATPGSDDAADAPSRFHCDVCGVTCPDSSSYTLHINGRKHRNKLDRTKKEEERKVAESMMAMKRMQLFDDSGGASSGHSTDTRTPPAKQKKVWSTPKKDATTTLPKMKSPSPRSNTKLSSFRHILEEEKSKSSKKKHPEDVLRMTPQQKNAMHAFPIATPSPLKATKKPPPTTSARISASPGGGASVSLGAFIERKEPRESNKSHIDRNASGWASKNPAPKKKAVVPVALKKPSTMTLQKGKSFFDIQKEEEIMATKEDHMCRIGGNKWYVTQRERAVSIGEIQEREKEALDMRELIEEQKQIEEQIARENRQKNNQNRKRDAQPPRKQKQKKGGQQQGSSKKTGGKERSGGGRKKKTPSKADGVKLDSPVLA